MAREDSWPQALRVLRLAFVPILDEVRPAGVLEWAPRVAPVVTQAVVGAGHWAAGRRRRALAAWTIAAGYGLVAWGLGTEAPTPAEVRQNMEQDIQRLQRQVVEGSTPEQLAGDAAKAGMVPAGPPAYLVIQPDGSSTVRQNGDVNGGSRTGTGGPYRAGRPATSRINGRRTRLCGSLRFQRRHAAAWRRAATHSRFNSLSIRKTSYAHG